MNNADLPAMPVMITEDLTALIDNGSALDSYLKVFSGLTKREMFAMAAMQGLISSGATYNGKTTERGLLATDAVSHADALLAELERTK